MSSAAAQAQARVHPAIGSVEQYVPLVRRVAARLARRLPSHVRFEDLVGAGLVGLMQATQRFDAARMAKSFEAFAEFRIKGAIYDELRRRDLMSRDARIDAKKLERTIQTLAQQLGRQPSDEEVARATGKTLEELHTAYGKLAPVQVVSTDDATTWDVERGPSPFEAADKNETRELLMKSIKRLPERHQQVLQLYYVEELTLKQIGELLEVTESRACQLIGEITVKLRALMGVETQGKKRKGAAHA
jgi:RNA polymerase sigma factor for flagellar operon FliA